MKKLLIIIDMVNGFVKNRVLADTDINNIAPNIIKEIKQFIQNKDEIISFQEAHKSDSKEFETFPKHCIIGTKEADLIDELVPYQPNMKVIFKNSTSGFVTKSFLEFLENNKNNFEEVFITGCCTDICIINFAIPLKNYFNEYNINTKVVISKNCVDTYNSEFHNKDEYNKIAFKLMEQAGIIIK